jgi:Plasmid pRiA4b ORF-3-like protein
MTWSHLALKHGVCIDGANACPPEDVGGVGGYEQFLEALANPLHEEHDSYLVWVGYQFDPEAFDLGAVNAALQRVR